MLKVVEGEDYILLRCPADDSIRNNVGYYKFNLMYEVLASMNPSVLGKFMTEIYLEELTVQ